MNKDNNMYFEKIMAGLNESLDFSKGDLKKVRRKKVTVSPIPKYSAKNIKQIRESLNLTQTVFAEALGVSVKTVEAWESGRNHPQGPASRVLQLLELDHSLLVIRHAKRPRSVIENDPPRPLLLCPERGFLVKLLC